VAARQCKRGISLVCAGYQARKLSRTLDSIHVRVVEVDPGAGSFHSRLASES
jgi:hypothetical protein